MKIVHFEGSKLDFSEKHLQQIEQLGNVVTIPKDAKEDEIAEKVQEADVIITYWGFTKGMVAKMPEILQLAPQLKLILHAGGSVKYIVEDIVPTLLERNIRVVSCGDAVSQGVAETSLGLTIVSLKDIWRRSRYTRDGNWGGERERIKDVHEVTIGVISASKAGKHYIRLLQNFEVNIVVYDPVATDEQIRALGAQRVPLERLMAEADVVSIHAPSIPATNHLIHADNLKLMKDGAILINTARGTIIDEAALVAELQKGRIWACLDVTYPEPPVADHPFRTLPNVVLTPHLAGLSNNGRARVGRVALEELQRFVQGEPLQQEVNLRSLDVLA